MSLQKIKPVWDGNQVHILCDTDIHWDFEQLGIKRIWEKYKVQGEDVNIFVLDTGIDTTHKAFANHKIEAKSFVANESPQDVQGHGTWCCGKVNADEVGISPKCNLFSAKVMDANGDGSDEDINKALSWVLSSPLPNVVSMSIGGYSVDKDQENLCNEIFEKGGIIVAAAGNERTGDKSYPAAFKNVLAISALDQNKKNADFANYGQHIAVAAPGVSCYSTVTNNQYRRMSGTSMATPIVASLISLGISYILKKKKTYTLVERDLIINALEKSATDLGPPGFDIYYGFGGVDGLGFMEYIDKNV